MSEVKPVRAALLSLGITLILAASACCQDYIVMGTPHVNIRTGPSTDHVVIGRAEKGDIFKVISRAGGWYEIAMFSEDTRYVFAADYVYQLNQETLVPGHGMVLSDVDKELGPIYTDVLAAMKRAEREAEEVIPPTIDEARNSSFRKIMEDRIILEVLHIHGLQPALYGELMEEKRSRKP
jgi:hypothetical protein